jgi:outer membrane protein OmpA-like peptidoglycan-associated protein
MRSKTVIFLTLLAFILPYATTSAQTNANIDELQILFDSTRAVEAYTFAPETYEKAEQKFNELKKAVSQGRKQKKINKLAGEFSGLAENALKAVEVTRITISEYLEPREKAAAAQAQNLVVELWNKAETQFIKGTSKVESGNVKKGLKEVEKAVPLFDVAELEAIKVTIMGEAGKLIEQAVVDQAKKYAPSSLDKARTALTKCEAILTRDRYERDESVKSAAQAAYEARHASNISQSVRSLERNDQAWERLMLLYEIEMQKVGDELGIAQVPFDNGPISATQAMIDSIRSLKKSKGKTESFSESNLKQLAQTLENVGLKPQTDDPVEQLIAIETLVADLMYQLDSSSAQLASLETTHQRLSRELGERQEKEAKIENARSILNPTEGEVLLNATDDIVVRLYGLSFASGSADITDSHVDLLKKVEKILTMFPESKLMVEGHTDDLGERTTNMRLSEKRAFSVMQYLRKLMSIPADKIDAVGYGPDKPIGTNTTKQGRAKNRRIDILIFQ